MDKRPIGIFDSGVGGLTVVKELVKELPNEDIIYFGDTARVPYGTKSQKTIKRFSVENAIFLLGKNVKLIIVACNSSSAAALGTLNRNFKVPIIGVIEPGVKDAILASKNKKIGIIGTSSTIRSDAYNKFIRASESSARVFSTSCPLFVPLVEEGWLSGKITLDVIKHYLLPLKRKGIDTLVLGCTHYPLLESRIRKVMGPDVKLVNSALSTARATNKLVRKLSIKADNSSKGKLRFFVSDEPQMFEIIGSKFLGRRLTSVKKVEYGL
ncbi:glutamate racemase [Candidatus Omnitrophota bacterium]